MMTTIYVECAECGEGHVFKVEEDWDGFLDCSDIDGIPCSGCGAPLDPLSD